MRSDPNQADGWSPVGFGKLGSWFLLMIVSYVLVTLVNRPTTLAEPLDESDPIALRTAQGA